MILVQNLRQLLSGNKFIYSIVVFLALVSCGNLKGVGGEKKPTTLTPIPEPDTENTLEETIQKLPKEKVAFQGNDFNVPKEKKTSFKIALILPFYTGYESANARYIAHIMQDYLAGAQMALNELEQKGFKARLYVYDNKNDTNYTRKILEKWELKTMDLIIGPIKNEHMAIVSKFSIQHAIPVFSPFTAIEELIQPNPLFYNALTDNNARASLLVDYWEKNFKNQPITLVRDGQQHDKSFGPFLINELDKRKLDYRRIAYKDHLNWNEEIGPNKNVVYISSTSQQIVSGTLGGLIQFNKKVSVFGEQDLLDFEGNDYAFWETLNMHVIGTQSTDSFQHKNPLMVQAYRVKYNADPNKYAMASFDQFSFFGEMLMAFGEYFPLFISNKTFEYSSTTYKFNYKSNVNHNNCLYISRFNDYNLKKVSP